MLDLNLRTAWNTARAAIPHMSDDWGRIVLMGSKHALDSPAGQAAYNVAKAGVLALAKSIAIELLDTNTTCNALLPSVINTDATRSALPYADYVNWPQPHEIADVINIRRQRGIQGHQRRIPSRVGFSRHLTGADRSG
jgi:NAD(P)-dependent dehydrogenase (short-subunit alcohol dehydrogenase family)